MTRYADQIEFRPRVDPPTKPGHYYGTLPGAVAIIPIHVERYRSVGDLGVWEVALAMWIPVEKLIWFGPVPRVQEASTP